MWKEFKTFAFKSNMIDMAVGVMIGAAFGSVVNSLVNDMFMPFISLITGGVNFTDWFIALDGNSYPTLAAAKEAGAACFAYGSFLTALISFFMIAFCVFIVVKAINKLRALREKPQTPVKESRKCPYCKQAIDDEATRCPHCTSVLDEE